MSLWSPQRPTDYEERDNLVVAIADVNSYLLGELTQEHCLLQPKSERADFMMVYASSIAWTVEVACAEFLQPEQCVLIREAIGRRLATNEWFDRERYPMIREAVFAGMTACADADPPQATKIKVPIIWAIEHANSAGCKLKHVPSARFLLYHSALIGNVFRDIRAFLEKSAGAGQAVKSARR